jgi:hypothetical protein
MTGAKQANAENDRRELMRKLDRIIWLLGQMADGVRPVTEMGQECRDCRHGIARIRGLCDSCVARALDEAGSR